MKLSRELPSPEGDRPPLGADVLLGMEGGQDDGIEFDPERDISEKDREAMIEEMNGWRDRDWGRFGESQGSCSSVSPSSGRAWVG